MMAHPNLPPAVTTTRTCAANDKDGAGLSPEDAIGRRIAVDEHKGTIRYYGQVPAGSGRWYFGVEWDDPGRGKHNGTYEGIVYFSPTFPHVGDTTCSFLKPALPKLDYGRAWMHALRDKYTQVSQEDLATGRDRRFGDSGVAVEMVGFQKVFQKQSNLHELLEVGLSAMRISTASEDPEEIGRTVPNIEDLDLSKNLLPSWEEVARICRQLKQLQSLRVGHNRFLPIREQGQVDALEGAFEQLKALSLISSLITWDEIQFLESVMPSLESLHLGFNQIQCLGSKLNVRGFQHLSLLNLESNKIECWDEIQRFRHVPNLEKLYLQQNQLTGIRYTDGFPRLTFLNLMDNRIAEWSDVDQLGKFPSLTELRLRKNPIVNDWGLEKTRVHLLGRLGRIQILNGSTLQGRDRVDAELYYLKVCAQERAEKKWTLEQLLTVHPRFSELVQVHGEPALEDKSMTSSLLKDRMVDFVIHEGERTIQKRLPKTTIIRNLKNIVHRLTGVSVRDQQLTFCLTESPDSTRFPLDDDLRNLTFYSIEQTCHLYVDRQQ